MQGDIKVEAGTNMVQNCGNRYLCKEKQKEKSNNNIAIVNITNSKYRNSFKI